MKTRLHKMQKDVRNLTLEEVQSLQAFLEELAGGLKADETAEISVGCSPSVSEAGNSDPMCYRLEWVKCGKPNCRCKDGKLHGPYWYAYYYKAGRFRSKYVGKNLWAVISGSAEPSLERLLKISRKVLHGTR